MRCFATCSFGLEALVRDELHAMSLSIEKVEDARVVFLADMKGVVDANLRLRCADRVFVELNAFFADSFSDLFDGIRKMPWKNILPADASILVSGKTALSKLVSVRDMQKLSKKAICDALCAAHETERCPETGEPYRIEIGVLRDRITVGLNTSGAGLNRRGYRDLSAEAPLRETLAAAMAMLSGFNGSRMLWDPCCGSGTIAIEAAMIATNMAPGLNRTFAFDEWAAWRDVAAEARTEAEAGKREAGFAHLYASDIDPKSVSMARRHAKRAGVNGFINFSVADVRTAPPPAQTGVLVTNPPYGERLKAQDVAEVERALGRIKRENEALELYVLSADPHFERNFGRRADRRRKLYNGNMRCQLHMFVRKNAGSSRHRSPSNRESRGKR